MSYSSLSRATALAAVLAALTIPPAQAGGVSSTTCLGPWLWGSCVTTWRHGAGDPHIRYVPAPFSDVEAAESREREKLWQALCRPQLLQDRYGVEHYVYAEPGCEYGRYR